jgi:hypothetical protein
MAGYTHFHSNGHERNNGGIVGSSVFYVVSDHCAGKGQQQFSSQSLSHWLVSHDWEVVTHYRQLRQL